LIRTDFNYRINTDTRDAWKKTIALGGRQAKRVKVRRSKTRAVGRFCSRYIKTWSIFYKVTALARKVERNLVASRATSCATKNTPRKSQVRSTHRQASEIFRLLKKVFARIRSRRSRFWCVQNAIVLSRGATGRHLVSVYDVELILPTCHACIAAIPLQLAQTKY